MTNQNATAGDSSPTVVDVPYEPRVDGLPIESFSLSSLLRRTPLLASSPPQRLDFELLVCCTAGSGHHEVDFSDVAVRPGRVIHVRPGQVHRWLLDPVYEAQLFLLRPLDGRGRGQTGPSVIEIDADCGRDIAGVAALADSTQRSSQLSVGTLEAARELLIRLLELNNPAERSKTGHEAIYDDFQRLLDEADPLPRSVAEWAARLDHSTRTLARACKSASGSEPKMVLDKRTALEAQRRLSEPGRTATDVATSLGFVELSHFTRFFKRVTGTTPSAFSASFAPDQQYKR